MRKHYLYRDAMTDAELYEPMLAVAAAEMTLGELEHEVALNDASIVRMPIAWSDFWDDVHDEIWKDFD